MFAQVGPDTIHPGSCMARVALPEAGAVAQFCGLVRNHNQGAQVLLLEYDAYPEMAEEVIREIMRAAHQRWAFRRASAVHRTGTLALGEVAVCVTVSSDHRDAAMQACRFIIDRLKAEAPIWKRETLQSGVERWVEESRPGQAGKGA
jgi:molybdopterin synthase catalytic subunit